MEDFPGVATQSGGGEETGRSVDFALWDRWRGGIDEIVERKGDAASLPESKAKGKKRPRKVKEYPSRPKRMKLGDSTTMKVENNNCRVHPGSQAL